MSRLQIPYDKVLLNPTDLDGDEFDSLLGHFFELSVKYPLVFEIYNRTVQYFAFVRDGQLYWVAAGEGNGFRDTTARRFFTALRTTQFPKIIVYQTSLVLYHSLLVYFQKKPELKVSSNLVDLDALIDDVEHRRQSALVTAQQPGNLIVLRYQDGKAISCYGGGTGPRSTESNAREEFLVRVYTLSSHGPFEIKLFTDLVVTHAEDARPIPAGYRGSIPAFYLSRPPKLVVRLKNRPLKTYLMTGTEFSIGRLPQNDIVIDNLGVSRRHTVIAKTADGYLVRDCESRNGTFLNGTAVTEAPLVDGDVVTIGKYQIVFQEQSGGTASTSSMDQTVVIPNFRAERPGTVPSAASPAAAAAAAAAPERIPRLFRRSSNEELVLEGDETIIGRGRSADVRLRGLFAPRVSLSISRRGADYVLRKTRGSSPVNINGEEMEEKILEEEDLIAIGSEEFVFKR
jgi:pSer/pThr/pTyr-binding forkhead associated (FHA) protein